MYKNGKQTTEMRTPYPLVTFGRVHTALLKISSHYAGSGKGKYTKKELLAPLSLSEKSGNAHMLLGAFSHYGIMQPLGGFYKITDFGKRLLEKEGLQGWLELALEALTSPESYSYLYSKNTTGVVGAQLRQQLMHRFPEVNQGNVDDIVKRYQSSFSYIHSRAQSSTVETSPVPEGADIIVLNIGNGETINVPHHILVKAYFEYRLAHLKEHEK